MAMFHLLNLNEYRYISKMKSVKLLLALSIFFCTLHCTIRPIRMRQIYLLVLFIVRVYYFAHANANTQGT